MSDREREIIKKMAETIPNLGSDEQNYILGVAEGLAFAKGMEKKPTDSGQPVE